MSTLTMDVYLIYIGYIYIVEYISIKMYHSFAH